MHKYTYIQYVHNTFTPQIIENHRDVYFILLFHIPILSLNKSNFFGKKFHALLLQFCEKRKY